MNTKKPLVDLSATLLHWYAANRRELPWRETEDPYAIWVSEIILQQTRVAQGIDYYHRFLATFPTVYELSEAPIDAVLKCWQGLGYYSRARNMHEAAQQIVRQFHGRFPIKYDEVRLLKGVGEYTAAAICSFAYHQPYAVVDGNVFRVLSRIFGIETPIDTTAGKREYTDLAHQLLDKAEPHSYNQAIMDFGALQCTPTTPDCVGCPFAAVCRAYQSNTVSLFPVKQGKTKVRDRYFYYLAVQKGETLWLRRRSSGDIWEGLYEFPLVERREPLSEQEEQTGAWLDNLLGETSSWRLLAPPKRFTHQLSHQRIHATFFPIVVTDSDRLNQSYIRTTHSELEKYPISRLMQRYLEKEP